MYVVMAWHVIPSSHVRLQFPSADRSVHVGWKPVTTLGFAYCALADLVYGNPTRPSVYTNPDNFNPERWLSSKGKFWDNMKFPSYGFGHRSSPDIGPSRTLLENNLQNLPRALFKTSQDPENRIDEMSFVDNVILHPKPFNARFQPRFGDEALLRDVMAQYGKGL
ncbi:uncharacterized protein BJ212DRAFT_1301784 [Suillus subaureus]|uniref:Uncharacterized protein n=1 Tax=Suillus subaureus TaxID=48587 RepID=A0A9P7E5C4_9AGAM|nr:uncharacterized protein BJ212DRAFT_1301784 [Suillus subaureus]KAG1811746.1 hypothetical protein BJ212DRAFT_1301784 [Suillus subaureus]